MKKLAATFLAITTAAAIPAAGLASPLQAFAKTPVQQTEQNSDEKTIAGGWETNTAKNQALTKEAKTAFEKATEDLVGVEYVPEKLLATQVVAGTNYRILCKSRVVVPDAKWGYSVMEIYEDLSGNTSVTSIKDSDQDGNITDEAATETKKTYTNKVFTSSKAKRISRITYKGDNFTFSTVYRPAIRKMYRPLTEMKLKTAKEVTDVVGGYSLKIYYKNPKKTVTYYFGGGYITTGKKNYKIVKSSNTSVMDGIVWFFNDSI